MPGATPRPGSSAGTWTPSTNSTPGHGSSREQDVAVEVDVVEQARDVRARRDAEARLDHAAEHAAEPERARGVHHAHRLADAAGLRELDVDAVRALGARGDVARACGSPRRRRSGSASAPSAPRRRDRPPASGCSQYSTPSAASCGSASSASSSVHASFTSTWSGTSATVAHRAHAIDVEAVAAAELQLQPPEAAGDASRRGAPCRRDRRARSSTTSAARRAAGRAAGRRAARRACPGGRAARRRSPRAPRTRARGSRAMISSSANGSSPSAPACLLDVGERRLRRLVVARDRAPPRRGRCTPSCRSSTHSDLVLLLGAAGDHERLARRHGPDRAPRAPRRD